MSERTATVLLGRNEECRALDWLLDAARAGRSSSLVIRGEAGVGKTALLDYVAERASGCRLARVRGVESEREFAFAGLLQLCGGSTLERAERLVAPQRDALMRAFGLMDGPAPEGFLVGLAALSLLSEVAEEQPLVCLLDDVQWLDSESVSVLSFVARRLDAEPIAMVFAVRDSSDVQELEGLPELVLSGLGDADARLLLEAVMPGGLDEQVRDRIVAETRGNPLALLELPRGLTLAELVGGFGLPEGRELTSRVEQSFLRRMQSLPPETQRLLHVAAAEAVGDAAVVARAAAELGIDSAAMVAAEDAGLIDFGMGIRFRHPLVRSAAYRAATPHERRQAHEALASATDPERDPDRVAWHRAHAAAGPDESVAAELERSASRAEARGGVAAAAAFLERAAELSPDAANRGTRALAAAQLKLDAGAARSSRAPGDGRGDLAARGARPRTRRAAARSDRLRQDARQRHAADAQHRGEAAGTPRPGVGTRDAPVRALDRRSRRSLRPGQGSRRSSRGGDASRSGRSRRARSTCYWTPLSRD